jgi:hypothetical protein
MARGLRAAELASTPSTYAYVQKMIVAPRYSESALNADVLDIPMSTSDAREILLAVPCIFAFVEIVGKLVFIIGWEGVTWALAGG